LVTFASRGNGQAAGGVIAVITDLTERKRAEAATAELARTREELVAMISHELRTPAALLIGQCELLASGAYSPTERREMLDTIEISVTDRGLGIPADALPRVFDKFYRVESADRSGIQGTGLGLAIVRELVEAMQGRVGVESDGVGQGARFSFTVPVAREQPI